MTKKDFFRIIIKLFGLYWLINSVYSIATISYYATLPNNEFRGLIYSLIVTALFIVLFIVLIYNADRIIHLLKLEKGFDEDRIDFQLFGLDNLIKLGLLIIGGFLILDNIPLFLNQSFLGFKALTSNEIDILIQNGQSTYQWFVSLTKITLGYLLLTNYPTVSKLLLKLTQKKD